MNRYLFVVDRASAWFGKTFAWSIVGLTAVVCYDVAARYLFRAPTQWGTDVSLMFYAALFMMAGAYTLSRNGHVRGDVLYRFLPDRMQAALDLGLYLLFFVPGIAALAWFGIGFFWESWTLSEKSQITSSNIPIYPLKIVIPAAGALLLLQGMAEIARCLICLRDGHWPQRLHDVEEIDVEELKAELTAGRAKESR